MNTCQNCQSQFQITEADKTFYQKMEVPEPTHCVWCRQQLRLAQVNQINLFQRKCDATGQAIISHYAPEAPFPVHSLPHWWSDQVDNTEFGQDIDWDRPFFEQLKELSDKVPRSALTRDFFSDENCDYTNYAGKNKDCYLIFDSDENRDCLYSYGVNASNTSSDLYRTQSMELCYECVDSNNCYNCAYVTNSSNCVDSMFLNNCIGVKNSLLCSNLRQKEYHVLNQPVTKEQFQEIRAAMGSYETLVKKLAEFDKFKLKFPQKFMRGFKNENVSGNHLVECKDAEFCFDSMRIWDGKYAFQTFMGNKNIMDVDEVGDSELMYFSSNCGYKAYNLRFCFNCLEGPTNLTYCQSCYNGCQDLFGCVGLKKKKFCILNKQYTQEEYEELMPRLIEHMKKTGEWGQYYPMEHATVPYNLSMAQEWHPRTKETAPTWREPDQKEYRPATTTLPDSISKTPDSICQEILACEECSKNYKVIAKELAMLRRWNLPLPRKCFHCRHKQRRTQRIPRGLYQRNCDKCTTPIQTAYAPTRPETVYCESCYLESVD